MERPYYTLKWTSKKNYNAKFYKKNLLTLVKDNIEKWPNLLLKSCGADTEQRRIHS